MKKTIVYIVLVYLLFGTVGVFFGGAARAENPTASEKALGGLKETADPAGLVPENKIDLPTVIGKAISILMSILGLIFLIVVLYGGVTWLTANGNADEVGKAKSMIIQGAIGLAVTLAAYSISYYVIKEITGSVGTQ